MGQIEDDLYWMQQALALAQQAQAAGEVPIGALLVRKGQVLGQGWNNPIGRCDPSAHAEILALRAAGQAEGNYRLPGTTLYVTLEPCPMCAGALLQARVARVVYGAGDSRNGAAGTVYNILQTPQFNHRAEVHAGVLAEPCAELLRNFFRAKRKKPLPKAGEFD